MIDGGRGVCNAVYVDDVCEAIMAALDRDDAVGEAFLINGDTRITWRDFITTFADMVDGEKTVHDHSLDEIAAYWQAKRPRARDSVAAAIRLAGSPAFHAQLGTIPPVGKLIRGTKEMVARRITPEQKMMTTLTPAFLQTSSDLRAPSSTMSFLASMSAVMPNCAARSFMMK